jgi:hypothetical protein
MTRTGTPGAVKEEPVEAPTLQSKRAAIIEAFTKTLDNMIGTTRKTSPNLLEVTVAVRYPESVDDLWSNLRFNVEPQEVSNDLPTEPRIGVAHTVDVGDSVKIRESVN